MKWFAIPFLCSGLFMAWVGVTLWLKKAEGFIASLTIAIVLLLIAIKIMGWLS